MADEEPGSEASEWEKREREGYLAQAAEEERAGGLSIIFLFHVKHRKLRMGEEEATS